MRIASKTTEAMRGKNLGSSLKSLSETGFSISDFTRADKKSRKALYGLVKSTEPDGLSDKVIYFTFVAGKPFVMRGSNRIFAAKMLPSRRGELLFKEVSKEFGGYNITVDIINAAVRVLGKKPFD